jgi:hypothetical protein
MHGEKREPGFGIWDGLAETVRAAWKGIVRFHSNQVGAAGDQPDPGAPAPARREGEPQGLTQDDLYGEGEDDGEGPGAPGAKAKGEDGKDGKDGKDAKDGKPAWDAERQRRDQEHATERRALMDQNAALQETALRLLERLETAGKPARGAEADEEVKELEEAIEAQARIAEALTDESDPVALVQLGRAGAKANQAIAKALKKVRSSSGASPELAAVQQELEELRRITESAAAGTTAEKRKKAWNEVMAECQKRHGAQHTNAAINAYQKFFMDRGYDPNDPTTYPTDTEQHLALRNAFLEIAGAAKSPKKPAGDVPLDDSRGGGPADKRRKTGSLTQVLERMRREGKLHR